MNALAKSDSVFEFRPVGVIRSPFREKFGIPRQSLLAEEAQGRLELLAPFDRAEALRGLEDFSHVWLIWVSHASPPIGDGLTVRPPRLGGNRRVGVFASRSPVRPNPIGLSVVRLLGVEAAATPPALVLGGLDLLDGTPVLDIKPYLPYADALPDAEGGFAPEAPEKTLSVRFSPEAERFLSDRPDGAHLGRLIGEMIAFDPRPAYVKDTSGEHAFRIYDFDVHWRVQGVEAVVERIDRLR